MSFDAFSIVNSNPGNLNPTTTFTGVVPLGPLPGDAMPIETDLTAEKTTKKLSEHIWVKLEDGQQEQVMKLPDYIKKMDCYSQKRIRDSFKHKSTLLKNAVFVDFLIEKNKQGKKIFNLTKESIVEFSVPPEKKKELTILLQEADKGGQIIGYRIRDIIHQLNGNNGRQEQGKITAATAEMMNACFGKTVFDLQSLLDQGIQEAKKEAELLPAYKSKKRSLSDTGAKLEENFEPGSKKRRTDDYNIRTARAHILTPDDYLAANELVELRQSEEYPLVAPLSSGQIDCYFQQPIRAPFVSE